MKTSVTERLIAFTPEFERNVYIDLTMTDNLIMFHSPLDSAQFPVKDTYIQTEVYGSHTILRFTAPDRITHRSVYIQPKQMGKLLNVFKCPSILNIVCMDEEAKKEALA